MKVELGKLYVTVSGHKVEIVSVSSDPGVSHPVRGFIFNRYRGVEKSPASWRLDGKLNLYDDVFCLVEVENNDGIN